MIEVQNVNLQVGQQCILDNVNIAPEVGKITMLLGPNGAGKSTLLKCMSGILSPSNGHILLDGCDIFQYDINELAKKRATLSQSTTMHFPFTAEEIVIMGRNPHIRYSHNENDIAIINEVLCEVDADTFKKRIFPTLSGGEQQRIQLARVLVQIWQKKNAYLLLDEPTTALDLKHQHQLFQLLKKLAQQYQWTIMIVIHDLHIAKMYADDVIFMQHGKASLSDDMLQSFDTNRIAQFFDISTDLAQWYNR